MREIYQAPPRTEVLLPTHLVSTATVAPARGGWREAIALLSCVAIFVVDVVVPGVLVGLLYGVAVLGVARVGNAVWPLAVCVLGTVFHAVAGVFDLAAVDLETSLANRLLATLALWAIGGYIAWNIGRLRLKSSGWTRIAIN
jgi:hypothetical protein